MINDYKDKSKICIINIDCNIYFSSDMKFILPGGNVKILGKAIHCLAKIGDEVDIEPDNNCLTLRTVNLSR